MNLPELARDGGTVLQVLSRPARGFASLAAQPRAAVALLAATALALAAAAVVVPRTEYGSGGEVPAAGEGPPAPEPTPFERAQAAETARKLGQVTDLAAAAALPLLLAGIAACALSVAFRVAGAPVAVSCAFPVAAHGMLPLWLARALAIPAAILHAPVARADVPRLLPSSAAALLPADAPPALAGALSGVDLFALWAVALVALGMSRVSGASRARALSVTLTLYACWIALSRVALPAFFPPAPPAVP